MTPGRFIMLLIYSLGVSVILFSIIHKAKVNKFQKTHPLQVSIRILPPDTIAVQTNLIEVAATNGIPSDTFRGNFPTENPGFLLDLNGDGTIDFVQLRGDTLYWKPNQVGESQPILVIKGDLAVYAFVAYGDPARMSLRYWLSDRRGFIRPNLGNNKGIPYFGDAEELK